MPAKGVFVKKISICLLMSCAGLFAGQYLVTVPQMSEGSYTVIQRIDDLSILLLDADELVALRMSGVSVNVLDENPEGNTYYLVFPLHEDETVIAACGDVLERFDECLLVKATGWGVDALNRLQVELSRLDLAPIVEPRPQITFETMDYSQDTLIQAMVAAVSEDSIYASILRMQRMYTRHSMSDSNLYVAAPWIYDRLTAYGCDSVYLDDFSGGYYGPNIIGIKLGTVYPSTRTYAVICGHMDDVPNYGYAPGADDNASGTTAVLEAARVMQDYDFEYTVYYIGFNAEEQGLIGSDDFADRAYSSGDTILGVFNFDMIGYVESPQRDTMNAHYTVAVPGCSVFVCDFFQSAVDTYTQLKVRQVRNTQTWGYSDHASFWEHGYIAMCGIERVLCPGYHTVADTIGPYGVNSLPFATEVIKAGTAALAKLAVPVHGQASEERTIASGKQLFHIQPNPGSLFNIYFEVKRKSTPVHLRVYDPAGQLIRTITQQTFTPGIHSAKWDGFDDSGRRVAEGVYIVSFTGDTGPQQQKIVFIR